MVLHTALKYFNSGSGKLGQGASLKPHILTTNVEHDAILLPLRHYETEKLAGINIILLPNFTHFSELTQHVIIIIIDVDFVPVSMSSGQVLIEEIEKLIKPNTCLVTVMLANNETGVIMPVAEISRFVV